jgi:hypothetical protein
MFRPPEISLGWLPCGDVLPVLFFLGVTTRQTVLSKIHGKGDK